MRPGRIRRDGYEMKDLQVMTDHRLDALAQTFQKKRIRELLRISFHEYIGDTERYDLMAEALRAGRGLQRMEGNMGFQLVAV